MRSISWGYTASAWETQDMITGIFDVRLGLLTLWCHALTQVIPSVAPILWSSIFAVHVCIHRWRHWIPQRLRNQLALWSPHCAQILLLQDHFLKNSFSLLIMKWFLRILEKRWTWNEKNTLVVHELTWCCRRAGLSIATGNYYENQSLHPKLPVNCMSLPITWCLCWMTIGHILSQ